MTLAPILFFLAVTVPSLELDVALAARYFQEAKWISDDDGGKLWGQALYGPMIFVDPRTREAVANENPPRPGFEAKTGVFVGKFPEGVGIANYALDWGGKRWTMVMWPLPENRAERATLMAHELFHRIQPALKFPGASPKNGHLEFKEGRLWLQMELAALARALGADDSAERNRFAADALIFRATRHRIYPAAKAEEDALELNEGLAQFTGFYLRGGWEPENRKWLGNQLRQSLGKPSYTRTFAYWTGAAYAFLLNVVEATQFDEIRWRKRLTAESSLAGEYAHLTSVKMELPIDQAIGKARAYGYDEVLVKEESLEAERKAQQEAIRKRMLEGPVLILTQEKMNIAFDNRTIVSLGEHGTFYGTATLNNEWGSLAATDGVLISADFKVARVQAPASAEDRKGPGWTLTLKPGWKLVPGDRKGDFRLAPSGSLGDLLFRCEKRAESVDSASSGESGDSRSTGAPILG